MAPALLQHEQRGATVRNVPLMVICDTREPWPHPWAQWMPETVRLRRGALETGDFALAGIEDGALIERKSVSDLLGCMTGTSRDRSAKARGSCGQSNAPVRRKPPQSPMRTPN